METVDHSNIRPVTYGDRKYIIQSYLYDMEKAPMFSQRNGEPAPGLVRADYMHFQHKLIEDFFPRCVKAGSAYMLCEPGSNHLFRGYLLAEPYENLPVVHFLKIKKNSRNMGAATALLNRFYEDFGYDREKNNCVYTHLTQDLGNRPWCQRFARDWGAIYLPWFVYLQAAEDWDR